MPSSEKPLLSLQGIVRFCILKAGMRRSIRIHQSVYAEIAVIGIIVKISSIYPLAALFIGYLQCLIHPFPYKASSQTVMSVEESVIL